MPLYSSALGTFKRWWKRWGARELWQEHVLPEGVLAVRRGLENLVDGDLVGGVAVNGFPYDIVCLWMYDGSATRVGPQEVIEHPDTGETRIQGRD